jgi:hypothetical protein
MQFSWIRKFNFVRMSIFPKLILGFNAILNEFQKAFFCKEVNNLITNFLWKSLLKHQVGHSNL